MSEFEWITDIPTIPIVIHKIPLLTEGKYKIWLGPLTMETQLMIVEYLKERVEEDEDVLDKWKRFLNEYTMDFDSLYITVTPYNRFIFSYMGLVKTSNGTHQRNEEYYNIRTRHLEIT